jgi:hypothetical protein
LLENLGWSISVVDVGVIDVGLAYNTKFILTDPAPKSNGFSDFALLELCLSVKIEDLQQCIDIVKLK